MVTYILNSKITRVNPVSLLVWNFQFELLFQSHYNLHIVQAIQPQIFLEMDIGFHLRVIEKDYSILNKLFVRYKLQLQSQ